MFLRNFCHYVFVRLIFSLAVLDSERKPPELSQHSLLVEVVRHLLDGISRKSISARIPVTIDIEPAVVERHPFDAHLLKLRNRAQHLCRSHVFQISPATPTHVVGLARWLRQFP